MSLLTDLRAGEQFGAGRQSPQWRDPPAYDLDAPPLGP